MIDEAKLIDKFGKKQDKVVLCSESWETLLSYVKRFIKEQPKTDDWIPCSEPSKHTNEVLIFNEKSYSVGYYDGKIWRNAIYPVKWQEIHHKQVK